MKKNIKLLAIGLITGIINGLFGSGGGTIIVPSLIFLIGLEDHKSHATAISIILPLSIISTIIYINHGVLNLKIAIWVAIGGVLGGFIGAKLLNKVPTKILRRGFGVFMIVAAIRMMIN
ncbi:MAG: sulfite exporter TauE/SafE family protein [Firmicutes bacterium]|nr:sulfite exporter TauE/SafE family protein [Bacillota bacterium]